VPGVARPALIAHAFVPVGAPQADTAVAEAYLRRVWAAGRSLGITEPLLEGVPADLPEVLPSTDSPAFRLLAAATGTRPDRVTQAFCFIRHDVIGIGVALASTASQAPLETWAAILRAWRTAGGDEPPPPQVLGTDRVFIAHAGTEPAALSKTYGAEVWSALKAAGLDAWDVPFRTADGFTVWDWQDPTGPRVVAILSIPSDEDDLSRWLWWQGDRELAPFSRYLLNAAKLGYETRVYQATRQGIVDKVHAMDRRLAELMAVPRSTSSMHALQGAQQRLAEARSETAALAIELTRLGALRRTIEIARHNLSLTTPMAAADQQTSAGQLFERDQAMANWLDGQIDQDVGYAQAAMERAREAQNVTQLRLQQVLTELTRAQGRVALLQTSLVAALLAGFTMVNVLGLKPSIPEAVKPSLLATGIFLLLALPPLAAHWYERYGLIDRLAAALAGSSAGWLVSAVLTGEWFSLVSLVTGALGLVLALVLTRAHDRRMWAEIDVGNAPPGR
jgi:hypothetical protein